MLGPRQQAINALPSNYQCRIGLGAQAPINYDNVGEEAGEEAGEE